MNVDSRGAVVVLRAFAAADPKWLPLTLNVLRDAVGGLGIPTRAELGVLLVDYSENAIDRALTDAVKRGILSKRRTGKGSATVVTYEVVRA